VFRRVPSRLNSSRGSSIIGFVLVVPLVITVFIAVSQLVMFVADKSTVTSAALAGARDASAADASLAQGIYTAQQILASKEYLSNSAKISASRQTYSGVDFVRMSVECELKVIWLNKVIHITSTSRSLDERTL